MLFAYLQCIPYKRIVRTVLLIEITLFWAGNAGPPGGESCLGSWANPGWGPGGKDPELVTLFSVISCKDFQAVQKYVSKDELL